jgi:DNA-binding XRE family transcriptional regulator
MDSRKIPSPPMEIDRQDDVVPVSFMKFGELLRFLRKRAQLTQRDLGRAVGYSESQINKLERGHRRPSLDHVGKAFIDALNLKRNQFLAQRLIELAESTRRDTPVFVSAGSIPRANGSSGPGPDGSALRPSTPWARDAMARTDSEPEHNLPAPMTSFVGREREIRGVLDALSSSRLVTLVGTGGCGKTRLALQVAESVLGSFPDGVWLVELAPVTDSHAVVQTVASALGVFVPPSRPLLATLVGALRSRRTLLVLDNCEHVIDACAELANRLLCGCQEVSILATSREPLAIAGEYRWRVPPMVVPSPALEDLNTEDVLAYESVQLFIDRAQLARGSESFWLTPAAVRTIARICIRLDGLPLAIELAAARVATYSVEDILDRLVDRFGLLVTGSRVAVFRQRMLAATIEWSYSLLSQQERTLFERLSVFADSWSLPSVEPISPMSNIRATPDRRRSPSGRWSRNRSSTSRPMANSLAHATLCWRRFTNTRPIA